MTSFILTLFFSQVTKTFRRWHIVAGQYLGFTALVLISLIGFAGSLIIPRPWIGLLGIAPILLGVRGWLNRTKEDEKESAEEAQVGEASKERIMLAIPTYHQ